jgi:integrase
MARPTAGKWQLDNVYKFFGDKYLSEINGAMCRAFVKARGVGGARRELETLRAAVRHYHREGYVHEQVAVWEPKPAPPRDRWLTRQEAALLLRTAWRRKTMRHVARFILVALYTGARKSRIVNAALHKTTERGYVDLDTGMFFPKPGHRQSKKRQPPIPLPKRLLAHLRRWERQGQRYVVPWHGGPLGRVNMGFREVAKLAGLEGVTPHTLRHTAATWLMQRGADPWAAAGYLGMSLKTLIGVYGHHHPDHLRSAVESLDRPAERTISGVHEKKKTKTIV